MSERSGMETTEVIEDLRIGLERVIERAHLEAGVGAPAHMVAVYVEQEARHTLAGHGRASNGMECSICKSEALTAERV